MSPPVRTSTSDLAGVLLTAARTYLDSAEWDAAERCLREVLALGHPPADAATRRAQTLLGHVDAGRGDGDAALARWSDALALHIDRHDAESTAECLGDIAALHLERGELKESEAAAARCLRLAQSGNRPPLRARALETLGTILRLKGDLDGAREHHQKALDLRIAEGDLAGQARNHTGLGNTCHRLGRLDEALAHHRHCLSISETLDDSVGIAKALNNIGTNLIEQGDYDGAADHFRRAKEHLEDAGEPRMTAHIDSNLGLVASYRGDTAEAERYYRESLAAREAVHDVAGQAISLNNLSNVAHMAGRYEEAIGHARRSIELRLEAGFREGLDRPWYNLAISAIELGRLEEAADAAERVAALSREQHSLEAQIQTEIVRCALELTRGEPECARESAERAVAIAQEGRLPRQRGEALRLEGETALELDDLERARERLLLAEHVYRDLNAPYPLARCRLSLGRLFLRVGACEAAADRLRRAAAVFGRLGNDVYRWRSLIALAEAEWPLSRHQSRVTLAEAGDLARSLGRSDFSAETERVADDLVRRSRAAAESPDSALIVGLAAAIRDETELSVAIQHGLDYLVSRLELDVAFVDLPDAPRHIAGPKLADGVPERVDELMHRARRTRDSAFHAGTPDAPFWGVVPIPGPTNGTHGYLGVSRSDMPDATGADRPPRLLRVVEAAAATLGLGLAPLLTDSTHTVLPTRPEAGSVFHGLVGDSDAMKAVYRTIKRIAPTNTSVLIQGESGTGKELVANAIHARSARSAGPFVAISCPSIPRELIESELFGHEKGAFTGAHATRAGRIESADGGTLFLDEIGDMDLGTQSKLLRFLQEREFTRVGGRNAIRVNVRLVAATSVNLEDAILAGRFREDLFYRISVAPLRLPPLRSRPGDVARLAVHFLREFTSDDAPIAMAPKVVETLCRYPWPGNVRELRNLIEFLVAMAQGDTIGVDQIPTKIRSQAGSTTFGNVPREEASPLRPGETLESRLMSVEGALIRDALDATGWIQSRAADVLGITESKIRHRMKRYGIRRTP